MALPTASILNLVAEPESRIWNGIPVPVLVKMPWVSFCEVSIEIADALEKPVAAPPVASILMMPLPVGIALRLRRVVFDADEEARMKSCTSVVPF